MACKNTDTDTIRVLAMADYDDVFFDTGVVDEVAGSNEVHNANGVDWYIHLQDIAEVQNWGAMGFSAEGDEVWLHYCDDYENHNALPEKDNTRLCFGTVGDVFRPGYRCGDQVNLRDGAGTTWERLIYTSDEVP